MSTLNPRSFEACVAVTDGAGAIALARKTGGIQSVAFATDGTNGVIVLTIDTQEDALYPAWGAFNGAEIGATVQPTQATGTCSYTVQDEAGLAVDLAAVATAIGLFFVPTGVLSGGA
jgi:3-oxoacyl-[acyl-carrier-protein] synthase III